MNRLSELFGKEKIFVVGLMAGTSLDGIDAALVSIEGCSEAAKVSIIDFLTLPYSRELKNFILKNSNAETSKIDELTKLNFLLGEAFADAALAVIKKAGKKPDEIDLVGSHGQTVHHLPKRDRFFGRNIGSTMQIGEPSVISRRTGIITVADFRPADIAAGGEGAPLIPYVDKILFTHEKLCSIALNIGGIANITLIPPKSLQEEMECIAFDTGPGNMLIDLLMRRFTNDELHHDEGGGTALSGSPDKDLLERMLEHPFLQKEPPKSTGREEFGGEYADWLMRAGEKLAFKDIMATVTAFTVETISRAIETHIDPLHPADRLIVSGGGVKNRALMKGLGERLPHLEILTSDQLGIPSDAKEAIGFAILANETIHCFPGNMPSATGASNPAILGKICL
jgi:anhydro-N-acetylmuramic acid kinase